MNRSSTRITEGGSDHDTQRVLQNLAHGSLGLVLVIAVVGLSGHNAAALAIIQPDIAAVQRLHARVIELSFDPVSGNSFAVVKWGNSQPSPWYAG